MMLHSVIDFSFKKFLLYVVIPLMIAVVVSFAVIIFFFQEGSMPQELELAPMGDASVSAPRVIRMTARGFVPNTLSIRKGEAVVWINEDATAHWPASDVHPTHLRYPEFDPREQVAPGGEWSLVFLQIGTWPFHDHLYPRNRGTVRVLE